MPRNEKEEMKMNKKLRSFICFVLIVTISISAVSIVFARKPDKGPLEKIVFIHHRKDYVKPPWAGGPGGPDDDGEEGYYKLLGAKWQETPVSYVINPTNPDGLSREFITEAIFLSAEEWDANTTTELFYDTYTVDYSASWDTVTPDYQNELVFGDYDQDGVIAVCIVWGYFRGASGKGQIVEFDIMFDTDFAWGDADVLGNMVVDLQNIATHELGHGVGLADLYNDVASEETMYGYSGYGETKKRTLYLGDVVGIQELYGSVE